MRLDSMGSGGEFGSRGVYFSLLAFTMYYCTVLAFQWILVGQCLSYQLPLPIFLYLAR